jgi:multidrug efflux pump subunit AcrB
MDALLVQQLEHSQVMTDVSSDLEQKGAESDLIIDRPTASRLGITPAQIDDTLYDAFGQRQVSVIYSALNQYHVVMEIDPATRNIRRRSATSMCRGRGAVRRARKNRMLLREP